MALIGICEDDEDIRDMLADLLAEAGHEVFSCESVDAVACIRGRMPDVVLLDLLMPRVDGKAVYQALRDDAQTCPIPIIIVSATLYAARAAKELKAEALIAKPFPIERLLLVLDEVLHNPKPRTSLASGDACGVHLGDEEPHRTAQERHEPYG